METELGWKIVRLLHQSEKICSHLADDSDENKKVKGIKKGVAIKKIEDYKHQLEANQLGNKISHLEKSNLNEDSLGENDFIIIIMYLLKTLTRLH